MQRRFIYNFFIFLIIFAAVLLLPVIILIDQNSRGLVSELEKLSPFSPEQKLVYKRFVDNLVDDLVTMGFYVLMTAFLISLFLGRRLIKPLKELYKGALSIKEGNLDVALKAAEGDELEEVTTAFNEMALALRTKTDELLWKERYVSMMTDPLWVLDFDDKVMDINPAFTRLFGYGRDEIIGYSCFDFLDEENERILRRNMGNPDEVPSPYELSILSKCGEPIDVLVSGAPIYNEKKEAIARIGIMKDFRRETLLRKELRQASDQRRVIMDSMPDVLIVVDREFKILMANKAAREFSPEGILKRHCHEVFHSLPVDCRSAQGRDCPVIEVFEKGQPASMLEESLHGDKLSFRETAAYPIWDESGQVASVIVVSRDITEKKQFEEEIGLRNRELSGLLAISKLLNRSLRAEEIFNPVLEKLVELFRMDGGGIFFIDEEGKELACRYHKGLSQEYMNTAGRMAIGEDIPGRVAATGQAFTSPDLLNDPRAAGSRLLRAGIRACAGFPIIGREKPVGVICLFSFGTQFFSQEEEGIIKSAGEITAMAFENIRLYEKMRLLYQNQRWRRSEEQKELLEIASALAGKLEIREMLDTALIMLRQNLRADFAWFLEMEDGGSLVLKSAPGMDSMEGSPVYSPDQESIEQAAIERRGPVVVSGLEKTEYALAPDIIKANYKSAYSFPVYLEGKARAAMTFFGARYREPREEDIFFLQTVGAILGMAIDRARLYEKFLVGRGMSDTVLGAMEEGVILVDMNGTVISMNRKAGELAGIGTGPALGKPLTDIFGGSEENEAFRFILADCLEATRIGNRVEREFAITGGLGAKVPLILGSSPARDRDGSLVGVIISLKDASRLEEAARLKSEFVRSLARELRTPMTAIVGFSEMLLEGELSAEKQRAYLDVIQSEGRRVSDLVANLLDLSSIESGRAVLRLEPIRLENLLSDITEELSHEAHRKGIIIKIRVPDGMPPLMGDNEKMRQVMRNLLDNAITYSDGDSNVDLTARESGGSFEITLKDRGWGIPEEDLEHIGRKFFRGRHAARVKGKGLGLALSREIVRIHNGKLEIDSITGRGTTVRVRIPAKGPEPE